MAELRMPAVDFFGMFSALGDTIEKAREEAATRRTLASLFGDMPQQQQAAPVAQPSPTISGPARQQSLPTVAAMQGVPTGTRFDDIFRSASGKYGLPEGYLARTAQIESQLDPNAKNPNSSAGGLFQFIDGTARQYGLANRFDPAAATDAAARLASDNRGVLRRALGRDPTPGELYLAHQQGAGNAAKLLANPDAPASAVLGEQAFRLNGGRAGMTAAQFASKWTGKFGSGEGAQVAQATASDAPLPVPAGEYLANRQASRDAAQQAAPQSIAPAVASNAPQFGGVNPAMVKALVMNKGTRQIGMQLMQSMLSPKTSPFDFVTVGENMVRVNKQTGAAEVLPGLGKQVDPLDRSLKEVQLEKARRDLGNEDMERVQVNGQYYERKKGSNGAFQAVESLPVEKPKADPTTDMKNYEAAKAQGFGGSFVEYQQGLKKAGATSVNVGGGSDKQIFDAIDESAKAARAAATGLQSISEARRAVEGGGVFGSGADFRLGLRKVAALLGADNTKVVNTETFRSAVAPQIAATMKATVGSTQISNADREFAEKAAGGAITLDEQSIRRLLGIMEKAGNVVIQQHRDKMDAIYPNDGKFARERALFGVDAPKTGIAPGQSTTVNGIKIERIQ